MTYLEYLKSYDNIDKFVLFLLSLDFTVEDTARATDMTRQSIYNVIKRNKQLVKDYMASVKTVVEAAPESQSEGE